jgi:folate-binding protein YgfZ
MKVDFQLVSVHRMPDQNVANTISTARLDAFRVLIISGPDRVEFLQGQLTQDVTKLETTGTSLAGWASAKGRLLAAGQLIAAGDEIWWPLPADIVGGVAQRLKMFVLRSDVKIVISTMPISGLFGVAGLDQLKIVGNAVPLASQPSRLADRSLIVRVAGDPDRAWLIGPTAEATGFGPAGESAWTLQSIRTGQPFIVTDTQELFVPQMLNLDLIGAISFDKGCYVGQEIVARTQNLGRIKRRMYRFTTDNTVELPPGAGIYGPDNATGKVVLSSENKMPGELLAVVPINAASGPWFADKTRSSKLAGQPLPYRINE